MKSVVPQSNVQDVERLIELMEKGAYKVRRRTDGDFCFVRKMLTPTGEVRFDYVIAPWSQHFRLTNRCLKFEDGSFIEIDFADKKGMALLASAISHQCERLGMKLTRTKMDLLKNGQPLTVFQMQP